MTCKTNTREALQAAWQTPPPLFDNTFIIYLQRRQKHGIPGSEFVTQRHHADLKKTNAQWFSANRDATRTENNGMTKEASWKKNRLENTLRYD